MSPKSFGSAQARVVTPASESDGRPGPSPTDIAGSTPGVSGWRPMQLPTEACWRPRSRTLNSVTRTTEPVFRTGLGTANGGLTASPWHLQSSRRRNRGRHHPLMGQPARRRSGAIWITTVGAPRDGDPRDDEPHHSTRDDVTFTATQSRQNSLPSTSCITRHDSLWPSAGSSRTRTAPRATSRAHSASSTARRSSPTSPIPTRTSRCSRFLTTLPSGTRWKNSRGPTPEGSMHANAEP